MKLKNRSNQLTGDKIMTQLQSKIKNYKRYQIHRNIASRKGQYGLLDLYHNKMDKVMKSIPKNSAEYHEFMIGIVYPVPFISPFHNY